MGLILTPSFDDQTRQQIEDYLSIVRSRRMSAALEYHQGQAIKLQHETEKVQGKFNRAYETLARRLAAAEKAEEALNDALSKCEMLRGELGLLADLSQ
jgi:uncharacterized protein YecT (DUF1311 family)